MSRPIMTLPTLKTILPLLIATCFSATTAIGQAPECRSYEQGNFLLPNPLAAAGQPLAIETWGDHLIILNPIGIHILEFPSGEIPRVLRSFSGEFTDIAVVGNRIYARGPSSVKAYNLPTFSGYSQIFPGGGKGESLDADDNLLIVSVDSILKVYDISSPPQATYLGEAQSPFYIGSLGMGKLTLKDSHALSIFWGGNNIMGYHSALMVWDLMDPTNPVVTDVFDPNLVEEEVSLCLEVRPHGPGFVLTSLVARNGLRPEYVDCYHFLSRFEIDPFGKIQWKGSVSHLSPMSLGFALIGDEALWLLRNSTFLVDLNWSLEEPLLRHSSHEFPAGPAEYLPGPETLAVDDRLFHLGSLIPGPSHPAVVYSVKQLGLLDDRFAVTLRHYGGDWYQPASWSLRIVDYGVEAMDIVDRIGGSYEEVDRFSILGRHIFYDTGSFDGNKFVTLDTEGTLSEPSPSPYPPFVAAIPWDKFFVASHEDFSLGVYTLDDAGLPSQIALVPSPAGHQQLVRGEDILYATNGTAAFITDLQNPNQPRYLGTTQAFSGSIRYAEESDLMFRFEPGILEWYQCDAPTSPTRLGIWTMDPGVTIRDVHLSGDLLYLALGEDGTNVYRFDQSRGLSLLGGDESLESDSLLLLADGSFLISPDVRKIPLDCGDPLPVAVSDFGVQWEGVQVMVSWDCQLTGTEDIWFVLIRESGGQDFVVHEARGHQGRFEYLDHPPHISKLITYSLAVRGPNGVMVPIEAASLQPQSFVIAAGFTLAPNPANPRTNIKLTLPQSGPTHLAIYDVTGAKLAVLIDERLEAGHHDRFWDGRDDSGRNVASGTYFLRLQTESRIVTGRLSLIR